MANKSIYSPAKVQAKKARRKKRKAKVSQICAAKTALYLRDNEIMVTALKLASDRITELSAKLASMGDTHVV